ncbi:MAG TPA: NADH-quinone oxidoreductase subunit M, partial [Candidatus Binatia bacterium]|nr:NADH-quinone oxidoreductase subunit M [Candidatus Binatia bacterium]
TLRALQMAFFPETPAPPPPEHTPKLEPISLPERLGTVLLLGTALLIGLFPGLLLDLIVPSFKSSLFEGLRKVSGL